MNAPIADARNPDRRGAVGRPALVSLLTASFVKVWPQWALEEATNVLRVLATMSVFSMPFVILPLPASQNYVELFSFGEPFPNVPHDIVFLHVRELFPHPHSSFGARSNRHPPTEYTSLVH